MSALLCVCTVALWPLSNLGGRNGMGLAVGVRQAPAFSQSPGLHLIFGVYENNSHNELWYVRPLSGGLDMVPADQGIGLLVIHLIAYAPNRSDWYFGVGLPFFLLLPLSLLGARRCFRRRTPPAGRCPTCGYDLRATPGRCPECGTIPAR